MYYKIYDEKFASEIKNSLDHIVDFYTFFTNENKTS